jgi:hypothetical protein
MAMAMTKDVAYQSKDEPNASIFDQPSTMTSTHEIKSKNSTDMKSLTDQNLHGLLF